MADAGAHEQRPAAGMTPAFRIGIDLGGTKIAAIALGSQGESLAQRRIPAPVGDYDATITAIEGLVRDIEAELGEQGSLGIGMPGSLSPATGLVQNANSTWLNGRPFDRDVEKRLVRPVRFANDANCFALSEAIDGAAAGANVVFGVILGTGCGGGIVHRGTLLDGPHRIAGEWGHTPLPWPSPEEYPGPRCWCGLNGCLETWLSGPALARDHQIETGERCDANQIAEMAARGNSRSLASLDRHASRLARGLAVVANLIDPDVIVLGGGLSHMPHLYQLLPGLIAPYLFSDSKAMNVRPPLHGAASGVRGAAWLWGGP